MEPARSDPNQQIPRRGTLDHPGLGLEARAHRAGRGRLSALAMAPFNAWPVLFVTFPVRLADDGAAAAGAARGAGGGDVGLLVRARLFRARAVLDRQRLPGRCADLRLADAVRGARPAGLPALFPALGFALARLIWTRMRRGCWRSRSAHGQRMAARPCAVGIPMECLRLRAVGAAGAGADGVADRAVGMTFLSVAIFASPAALIDGSSRGRKPWIAPVAALSLLVAMGSTAPCGCRCSRPH